MLDVRGMDNIMMKAGKASSNEPQLTLASPSIMKHPTMIKTGAVIAGSPDTAPTIGEKNIDNRNRAATTSVVSPVRPPAATPEEDST